MSLSESNYLLPSDYIKTREREMRNIPRKPAFKRDDYLFWYPKREREKKDAKHTTADIH